MLVGSKLVLEFSEFSVVGYLLGLAFQEVLQPVYFVIFIFFKDLSLHFQSLYLNLKVKVFIFL